MTMILKDFEIEEIGPGRILRLRCKILKKHEGEWREVKYWKEWELNKSQRINYPQAYMDFVQFCYQELKKIDELHICITDEDQFRDGSGNSLYDKKFNWNE